MRRELLISAGPGEWRAAWIEDGVAAELHVERGDTPPAGTIHLAGGGSCSWYQLARRIVELAGLECEVKPCTTAEMPRPAARPAYSVLGTERGGEVPSLPDWEVGLEQYLAVRVPAR